MLQGLGLLFFLVLNFAISWWNAHACGKTWDYTKSGNPFLHLVNISAYVMSMSGFTWCYFLVLGVFFSLVPVVPVETDGVTQYVLLFQPDEMMVFFDLGYLLIIFPVLGAGIPIMLQSYAHFYRERNFSSGAVAAYNTGANIYNVVQALQHVPRAAGNVFDYFGGLSFGGGSGGGFSSSGGSKDGRGIIGIIILVLIAVAIIGGWLTTHFIFSRSRREHAWEMRGRYDLDAIGERAMR